MLPDIDRIGIYDCCCHGSLIVTLNNHWGHQSGYALVNKLGLFGLNVRVCVGCERQGMVGFVDVK